LPFGIFGAGAIVAGILFVVFRVRAATWDGWFDKWWLYMLKVPPRRASPAYVATIGVTLIVFGVVGVLIFILRP
jgi:hypothetical protein